MDARAFYELLSKTIEPRYPSAKPYLPCLIRLASGESDLRENLVNDSSSATGLYQIINTVREEDGRGFSVAEIKDPAVNIDVFLKYLTTKIIPRIQDHSNSCLSIVQGWNIGPGTLLYTKDRDGWADWWLRQIASSKISYLRGQNGLDRLRYHAKTSNQWSIAMSVLDALAEKAGIRLPVFTTRVGDRLVLRPDQAGLILPAVKAIVARLPDTERGKRLKQQIESLKPPTNLEEAERARAIFASALIETGIKDLSFLDKLDLWSRSVEMEIESKTTAIGKYAPWIAGAALLLFMGGSAITRRKE